MTKKKKFHDPMKYVTEDVVGTSITNKITRKEKHTKRMDLLVNAFKNTWQHMQTNISESGENCLDIFNNHKPYFKQNRAERIAIFLIANNIARRGEPLHASTAIKKLAKMRYQGSLNAMFAQWEIMDSEIKNLTFSAYEQHEQNLHYFLYKKYGVMLLNASTYDCCTQMIEKYKSWGKAGADKLRHYENFAKKFYKSDIQVTR